MFQIKLDFYSNPQWKILRWLFLCHLSNICQINSFNACIAIFNFTYKYTNIVFDMIDLTMAFVFNTPDDKG